jgi:hypothetical protein
MSEPLHQTILLADIEGSGKSDDLVRRVKRHHMYEAIQYALDAAEVQRTDQRLEDRGDGVLALVSSTVPKAALLRALLTEVPARLHGYNRLAAESARVRLRVVLAAGEVALDEIPGALGGVVGWDLDQAFRLLDGEPLRRALRHRRKTGGEGEDVVICVSEAVYRGVVRHDHHGIRRDAFHVVTVAGKEGPIRGWLYGEPAPEDTPGEAPAGRDGSAGGADAADRAAAGVAFHGGAPSFGGGFVAGDQHGVSGGRVDGDVVMGNKIVGNGNGNGNGGERR